MARIAGVNIPTNKRVVIALQYIHGIGATHAKEIIEKVGIPAERRVNELSDAEVISIIGMDLQKWLRQMPRKPRCEASSRHGVPLIANAARV